MSEFTALIRRHWPSAFVAISLLLPWTLSSPFASIPLVRLVQTIVNPSAFGFMLLLMIILAPMMHLFLFLAAPRGFWRNLINWTAVLLLGCFSGFFVSMLLVGGREVYNGDLPGLGYALAMVGSLTALVWEPLCERRERIAAIPSFSMEEEPSE